MGDALGAYVAESADPYYSLEREIAAWTRAGKDKQLVSLIRRPGSPAG
jgi:hypothetical protein